MKRFIILSTLLILVCLGASPQNMSDSARIKLAERIRTELRATRSASDSVRILYNIMDLLPYSRKSDVAHELLATARRAGDHAAEGDVLRQLSLICLDRPAAIDTLMTIASAIPDTLERKGTLLFLGIQKAAGEAKFMDPEKLPEALMQYVKEDLTPKYDFYKDLFDLYAVMIFMRHVSSDGDLCLEYVTRLEDMVSRLPAGMDYIRNAFYTTAATYYTDKGFEEKAVECDRNLLKIIAQLEEKYRKQGRKYRSYDRYYFICYRRMLYNHNALTTKEIYDAYARCRALAEKDEEVGRAFHNDPRATAFFLLATKNYAGAIPYLRQAFSVAREATIRMHMVERLIEAADSAGDHDTKLFALEKYNELFSMARKVSMNQAMTELQMRYNMNDMKARIESLAIEKKDSEIETGRKVVRIGLIASAVLVAALIYLFTLHRKTRRRVRKLENERRALSRTIRTLLDGEESGER